MYHRVTDTNKSALLRERINDARLRIADAQERLATGKRINRPSDDPAGAGAVLRLRTSSAELDRLRRSGTAARSELLTADGALEQHETTLDRARAVLTSGLSDTTPQIGRNAIAIEIEALREQMLANANSRLDETYLFGGTRQDAPPYDPSTGAPAATTAARRERQLEPQTPPVAIGVTADTVFADANGTVFDMLTNAAAALRGTGDPDADAATLRDAIVRLEGLVTRSGEARTQIGAGLGAVEQAAARIGRDTLTIEGQLNDVEAADFAEAALDITSSERTLEAILQSAAHTGRRTLIDLLG